jgi:hypothetical protein
MMTSKYRRAATQVWAIGEQVKVGFLSLRIVGKRANGDWLLVNKDATKRYGFRPHGGLVALGSEQS